MNSLIGLVGSRKIGPRTTAAVIIGAGLADAWHFHTFGTNTDLTFIVAAASALGVHVATGTIAGAQQGGATPPAASPKVGG